MREGLLLGPSFPLRHISALLHRKYHHASIKGVGPVYIRPKNSDADVFIKVFGKREYDLSHLRQSLQVMAAYQETLDSGMTPIIVDAGANVGAASIWFSRQFPLARILAVEPDPANAELCRLNTRTRPNVEVIEVAIGSQPGRVILNSPGLNAGWAVQTVRQDNSDGIAIRTISDLVRGLNIPAKILIVKVDIEGFESDLFAHDTEWMDEAEAIIIEPHDWLFPGQGTSVKFQRAISDREFEILVSGENLVYVRLPAVASPVLRAVARTPNSHPSK